MARIRTIKPEFPQSESMGRVSRDARLLFVMLWTICDDVGRARAASRMLASLLFPYDDDAARLIPEWLMELEREKCIRVYHVDDNTYLQIEKWLEHQKIDHPSQSKFPSPPEKVAKAREASRKSRPGPKDLGRDQGEDRTKEGIGGAERAAAPPVISLPTNRPPEEFPVFEAQVLELEGLYPAVDVRQELRGMRGWLIGKPEKRKTSKGMMAFVNRWLAKEQNKGHERGSGARKPSGLDDRWAGAGDAIAALTGASQEGGHGAAPEESAGGLRDITPGQTTPACDPGTDHQKPNGARNHLPVANAKSGSVEYEIPDFLRRTARRDGSGFISGVPAISERPGESVYADAGPASRLV